MAKIGRPVSISGPRAINFTIRMTEQENERLCKYAAIHGLSKTRAIILGIETLYELDAKGKGASFQ